MSQDKPVTLAAIIGAHGVTGEVRLKLFGEGWAELKRYKSFNDGAFTLQKIRDDNKGGAVARFAECTDRNTAEKLRGTALTITRADFPELAEGEYYHADLLGLLATSETGEALGTVVQVLNFGAGDVIEVERPPVDGKNGKRFMVPMNKEAVLEWSIAGMVIDSAFVID
ncbi:MAG: ribosome maturation factor RimM [Allopontixanthobacter sediminis]